MWHKMLNILKARYIAGEGLFNTRQVFSLDDTLNQMNQNTEVYLHFFNSSARTSKANA